MKCQILTRNSLNLPAVCINPILKNFKHLVGSSISVSGLISSFPFSSVQYLNTHIGAQILFIVLKWAGTNQGKRSSCPLP